MAKNAGDKTWKIMEDQRQWAEDEQKRLKRSSQPGLTQAQFFGILISKYEAATPECARFKPPALSMGAARRLRIAAQAPESRKHG